MGTHLSYASDHRTCRRDLLEGIHTEQFLEALESERGLHRNHSGLQPRALVQIQLHADHGSAGGRTSMGARLQVLP